jgi:hypothetical protein
MLKRFFCNTALKVGDSTMGLQSGSFFYTDGVLRTNYHTSFERVWTACNKALKDIKATNILVDKKISKGTLEALLYEEEIRITVDYKEKDITTVGVRVGVSGSTVASQLIHDKIKGNLIHPDTPKG